MQCSAKFRLLMVTIACKDMHDTFPEIRKGKYGTREKNQGLTMLFHPKANVLLATANYKIVTTQLELLG